MRNLAQFWVFKGLMVILVISFGIWGIGDMFRGNPLQRPVARVGDKVITVQELNKEFEATLVKMRQSLGAELTAPQAKQFGLLDRALDSLAERAGVDLELDHLGIDVTTKAAVDWIALQPELRNKDGSFNKELFRKAADRRHMSEAEFIESSRHAMASFTLFSSFGTGGNVPKAMVDALYIARGQKRVLDVVTLANDSIRDLPQPDDKVLHDFYDKNPSLFTAPEYRGLTVAQLALEDIMKDVVISDEQVRKDYADHVAQYAHPERRDVLQVVVQGEAKGKEIADAARAVGNLAAAAKDKGFKTVPLNQTEEKTLLAELAKPVFSLKA
ncbi:MAG: peptidylprolyl isomerase, partial [Pseudomonadota bacterium]|nr:peptidylprolyl isomerase [Pseudomonadota bacterium]